MENQKVDRSELSELLPSGVFDGVGNVRNDSIQTNREGLDLPDVPMRSLAGLDLPDVPMRSLAGLAPSGQELAVEDKNDEGDMYEDDEDMYEDVEEETSYQFFGAERVLQDLYRQYLQERFDFVYRVDVENIQDALEMMVDAVISAPPRVEQPFPGVEAHTDNMHDTDITAKMAKFCATLAGAPEIDEEELLQFVVALKTGRRKRLRALRALAMVLDGDVHCESYGISEGVLLRKMAKCLAGDEDVSETDRRARLENLVDALSDMFDENGDPICVMGRMTRIYDALCSGDYLVPKNFLEQEIASKCSALVRELGDAAATSEVLVDRLEESYRGILSRH